MFKEKQLSIGRTFAYLYTLIQGILAIIWMSSNLFVYYPEKLSYDYIESAKTFVVDDYMGIMYSAFLAPIVAFAGNITVVHAVVSIIQTVAVYGAFAFFTKIFFENVLSKQDRFVASLAATTTPFIIHASFSIIPNALLLCATLVFVSLIKIASGRMTIKNGIALSLVSIAIGLLSKDYAVLALILLIPVTVIFIKKRNSTALLAIGSAVVVLILVYFCVGFWAVPESYGRVERSLGIYLYQRIAWPYLYDHLDVYSFFFGGEYFADTSVAITIPEKLFGDYFMTIKSANPDAFTDGFLRELAIRSLESRRRLVLTAILRDIAAYSLPSVATMVFYIKETSIHVLPNLLARFIRETSIVSKLYMCSFEIGSIIAFIFTVFSKGFLKMIKRHFRYILYFAYIALLLSFYYAFVAVRGFDYRNTLFTVGVSMIAITACLLRKESERE